MIAVSFPNVSLPLALGFSLLVIVLVGVISFGLYTAGLRSYLPEQSRRIALITGSGLLLWLIVTGVLAKVGFFAKFEARPPHILVGTLPALVVVILSIALPKSRALLLRVPPEWVVGLQTFRIAVEMSLVVMARTGVVPRAMTWEGKNFDVLTGLTALLIVYLMRTGKLPRSLLFIWNILGLLLLINVVRIAVLTTPGPLYHFTGDTPNFAPILFPFIWLPYFLVPLALLGHLVSLGQVITGETIVRERESDDTPLSVEV